MTELVERVDSLPPHKGKERSRSNVLREIVEEFIESDATYWRIIKDYDGSPLEGKKTSRVYNHFWQLIRREFNNKGIYLVMRNREIYLAKEGAEFKNEQH